VDHGARLEAILGLLRERGGRATVARRAIITTLLAAGGHVTADEITERVQRAHPDVHPSTTYRCLDALEQLGVVGHAHLGHGRAVYHLADDDHQHLVCDSCAAVIEVPSAMFDEMAARVRRETGFVLRPGHFSVAGLCKRCARRYPKNTSASS
jgi:Fur family transcriptional regulator, ferric uptake regulator